MEFRSNEIMHGEDSPFTALSLSLWGILIMNWITSRL